MTRPGDGDNRLAFTLVEVLVVISVLALLLALALPAMSAIRAQSRSTKCLSNLRQIGVTTETIMMVRKDLFPFWVSNVPASPPIGRLSMPEVYEEVREGAAYFVCPADRSMVEAAPDYTSYQYGPGSMIMRMVGRYTPEAAIRDTSERFRREDWPAFVDRRRWHPEEGRNIVHASDWRARPLK